MSDLIRRFNDEANNRGLGDAADGGGSALKDLVAHRRKITDLQAQRAALKAELKAITVEQDRIRQNMSQLDHDSPLYRQYVQKLTDQEARIERIREEQERLREAELAAQKELRAFVDGLTAD